MLCDYHLQQVIRFISLKSCVPLLLLSQLRLQCLPSHHLQALKVITKSVSSCEADSKDAVATNDDLELVRSTLFPAISLSAELYVGLYKIKYSPTDIIMNYKYINKILSYLIWNLIDKNCSKSLENLNNKNPQKMHIKIDFRF